MTYTVKTSHPGVDFGHVNTTTYPDAFSMNKALQGLVAAGFFIEVSVGEYVITSGGYATPLVTGPTVDLVEGA